MGSFFFLFFYLLISPLLSFFQGTGSIGGISISNIVLVSQGCCHKAPEMRNFVLSQFWGLDIQNQGVIMAMFPVRLQVESFPTSSNLLVVAQTLLVLGLQLQHFNVSFHPHMMFSLVYLSLGLFSSLKKTPVILDSKVHRTLLWSHLH